MLFFGVCFLYFIKLSAGKGFCPPYALNIQAFLLFFSRLCGVPFLFCRDVGVQGKHGGRY